jgi:hypothetical protein
MGYIPVVGTPSFPFTMPNSGRIENAEDEMLRRRAIALHQRGYQVGIDIDDGDPYLGRTISVGDLYYQTPRVPDHYFVQQALDGDFRPPLMVPGTLDDAIRGQLAYQETDESGYHGDPRMAAQARAHDAVLAEARRRAASGRPFRRPRA